jgi:hypothetical protein
MSNTRGKRVCLLPVVRGSSQDLCTSKARKILGPHSISNFRAFIVGFQSRPWSVLMELVVVDVMAQLRVENQPGDLPPGNLIPPLSKCTVVIYSADIRLCTLHPTCRDREHCSPAAR